MFVGPYAALRRLSQWDTQDLAALYPPVPSPSSLFSSTSSSTHIPLEPPFRSYSSSRPPLNGTVNPALISGTSDHYGPIHALPRTSAAPVRSTERFSSPQGSSDTLETSTFSRNVNDGIKASRIESSSLTGEASISHHQPREELASQMTASLLPPKRMIDEAIALEHAIRVLRSLGYIEESTLLSSSSASVYDIVDLFSQIIQSLQQKIRDVYFMDVQQRSDRVSPVLESHEHCHLASSSYSDNSLRRSISTSFPVPDHQSFLPPSLSIRQRADTIEYPTENISHVSASSRMEPVLNYREQVGMNHSTFHENIDRSVYPTMSRQNSFDRSAGGIAENALQTSFHDVHHSQISELSSPRINDLGYSAMDMSRSAVEADDSYMWDPDAELGDLRRRLEESFQELQSAIHNVVDDPWDSVSHCLSICSEDISIGSVPHASPDVRKSRPPPRSDSPSSFSSQAIAFTPPPHSPSARRFSFSQSTNDVLERFRESVRQIDPTIWSPGLQHSSSSSS